MKKKHGKTLNRVLKQEEIKRLYPVVTPFVEFMTNMAKEIRLNSAIMERKHG